MPDSFDIFASAPNLCYNKVNCVNADHNFLESMLKNPIPYSMVKLTFSLDKTTGNFLASKGHSQLNSCVLYYWIQPALLAFYDLFSV